MKKLLSALFILGSVAALAQEENIHGGSKPECYTSACKVEKDFEVKVKVPEQLKITKVETIDLGYWCGTKPKEGKSNYTLEGQKGAKVNVSVTPLISFKKPNSQTTAFTGNLVLDSAQKTLSSPAYGSGKASGVITATLNQATVKLDASTTYTAKATLTAEYDAW
ncbi:hypothetical protein [Cetobacterium sp. ZOR0034]|uniref:hypothetical protein n=1 Tax=Cetobacterium sp. ZOR0034 TaxID=1339239 RepID=UPI00064560AE|nr:hypothetical protein [Cetobacterium sp. ZOR0034]